MIPLLLTVFLTAGPIPRVGIPVSGPGYQGIIVACSAPSESFPCWQPNPDHIAKLEAVLFRALGRPHPMGLEGLLHPLREYSRQYIGYNGNGGTVIVVTGYHRSEEVVTSGRWLRAIVMVNGGGGNFFRGRYLVAHGQFDSLSINAPE